MAYKQSGFGNGKKASMIHSSPLNIRRRKKMEEGRGEKDPNKVTGVTQMKDQYQGMSSEQVKKAKKKAEDKAAKFEKKAASGRKLSAREQSFIDERDYNVKRSEQQQKHFDTKKKIDEQYGKPSYAKSYTMEEREAIDQAQIEADAAERSAAEADASANRFRDPGLVASEKRDPAEANTPDVDVVGKKKQQYSNIKNPEASKRAGHQVYYSNREMQDLRSKGLKSDYDEMGVKEFYDADPKTGQWKKTYAAEKGSLDRRNKALEDVWASGTYGKDAQFPVKEDGSKDYSAAYKTWKENKAAGF